MKATSSIQLFFTVACFIIHVVFAANCNTDQPRQSDVPSGQQIAAALQKNNALDNVCSNDWPQEPQSQKVKIYNEGSIIYNVTRTNTDDAPPSNNCEEGFQNIISQCIVEASYWGGTYFYNAFTYVIYNSIYPSNGLPSYGHAPSGGVSGEPGGEQATSTLPGDGGSSGSAAFEGPITTFTPTSTEGGPSATPAQPSNIPAEIPGATTVTQTNRDGSAVVGTFVPTTLPQYATLQSETTVTTTTTIDGLPVAVPLVIGAGGVAWATVGGVPVPGINPPLNPPNGSGDGDGDDDESDDDDEEPSQEASQQSAPRTTIPERTTFQRTTTARPTTSSIISSSSISSATPSSTGA
ncbi:MAG: hypothetical protein Q9174_002196 [Haloplaca sp. 1 TL-2023]